MQPKNFIRIVLMLGVVFILFPGCTSGNDVTLPTSEPTINLGEREAEATPDNSVPTPEKNIPSDNLYQNTDPSGQLVTFWHPFTGEDASYLLEIIQEFNLSNEWDIHVVAEYQGNNNDLFNKMLTFMNTADAPQLISAHPHQSASYHLGGALVDMNEFVYSEKWGLTQEERKDFFPGFFKQDIFPYFEGIRLGFPTLGSMEISYFNQDWLRELGQDTPPLTPEELNEVACAAARQPYSGATAEGSSGYPMSIDAALFASWVFAFGGDIYNEESGRFTYDSPEAVAAMQFIQNLLSEGCADLVASQHGDRKKFSQGTAFFTVASSAEIPLYLNAVAVGAYHDWSVIPIPHTTTEPVQNVSARSASIPKTSPEGQLAAWLLLKFLTSPEIQARWASDSGHLPVRASAASVPGDIFPNNPTAAAAFDMLSSGTNEPAMAGYEFIQDMVAESMYAISQGADVSNVLSILNADANTYLEEQLNTLPEPPDPWAEIDPSGQTVIFWHQQPPARHPALDELIWKFNSTNQWGITVVPEYHQNIHKKLQNHRTNTPNLVELFQNQTADLQLEKVFTDMTSLVESIKWGLSPQEKAEFFPAIYNQDIYPTFNNIRLGFPPHRSIISMYYNADWLAELKAAGAIDFDGPPQNPEQFKAAACAAAANPFSRSLTDTSRGYQFDFDASRFTSWVFAFGGDVFEIGNYQYRYDSASVFAAASYLQELFNQGCAGLIVEPYGDQADFSQGALLFTVGSSAGLPFYTQAVREGAAFNWSVAPIPHIPTEPVQNVYGTSLSVTNGTPESELAAWLFIKHFTLPDNQAQWIQASNYLPVRTGAAAGLAETFEANAPYAAAFEMLPYTITEPSLPGYDIVRSMVEEALLAIIAGEDVQAILDQLNEDANLTLLEYKP